MYLFEQSSDNFYQIYLIKYNYFSSNINGIQRGNVLCVQGAYGEPAFEELDEIFYIVK